MNERRAELIYGQVLQRIQEWIGGDTKMDHSCNSRSRRENYVKCR